MQNNLITPSELKHLQKLAYNILSTIIENSEGIEKALINNIFNVMKSHDELEPDKNEIDYLHLLWTILQDAKDVKKKKQSIEFIYEPSKS